MQETYNIVMRSRAKNKILRLLNQSIDLIEEAGMSEEELITLLKEELIKRTHEE